MDDRLDKIDNRLDKHSNDIGEIKAILTNGLQSRSKENTQDIKEIKECISTNNIASVKHRAEVTSQMHVITESLEKVTDVVNGINKQQNKYIKWVLMSTIAVLISIITWIIADIDHVVQILKILGFIQ